MEVYKADVAQLYGDLVQQMTVISQPLNDILHRRYSFCAEAPNRTDARMKHYKSVAGECKTLIGAMNWIELKEFLDNNLEQAVMDLYNFVVGNGSTPVAFPPLWDVEPGFEDCIISHPGLHYSKLHEQAHIIGLKDMELHSQWYLLLLPDACTVLQVFRENHSGVLAIVRSLFSWGIPFNMVRCLRARPRASTRMRTKNVGLGYWCKGH